MNLDSDQLGAKELRRVSPSGKPGVKKQSRLYALVERLVMDPIAKCASKNLELTEALLMDRRGFKLLRNFDFLFVRRKL